MAPSGRSRKARLVLAVAAALAIQVSITAGVASAARVGPVGVTAATRSYIVVLKPGVAARAVASEHSRVLGASVSHVYRYALQGYAARLPGAALQQLLLDPRVAYVSPDTIMHMDTTQTRATWGLDRIDQHNLPLSTTFSYTATGAGVTAYMIDTGIRFSHSDFGGRAVSGFDAVDGGQADDCAGHGTHTAGTVGGTKYGVAKAVTLVAVRVLDCGGSGATSTIVAGIDWVTGDHDPGEPAVANVSLGGGVNSALDNAVANSIADGVAYSLSAGNGNALGRGIDACNHSPGRVPEGMTISATNKRDSKPTFANFGNCVDWFAPGVGVTSDWHTGDNATNKIDGTSMSTPHNTGVAALYLQSHPTATPAQVRDAIFAIITLDKVKNSKTGAHNDMLFTNF